MDPFNTNFTICITTFNKRFEYLQKLIVSIRRWCNAPILVAVNGDVDASLDEVYRIESLLFFSKYYCVYPIYFTELRGLAKMFNTLIIHSSTDDILMLNDDLEVTDQQFFNDLQSAFAYNKDICKLQTEWYGSFSHFILKKHFLINEIGLFDERLLGFGEEDGDITFRYIQKTNQDVPCYVVKGLMHYPSDARHDIKAGIGKYSLYNRSFMFNEKYKLGEGSSGGMFGQPATMLLPQDVQYPYEQYFAEHKSKLK